MRKKSTISFLLSLFMMMLCCAVSVSAADDSKVKIVKVGYFPSLSFQTGADDDSRKGGYAYQFMTTISYFTNWKYEYVYGDFMELYSKLLSGEIDAMAGLSKLHDKTGELLFPEFPMGGKVYYIYGKSGNDDMTSDISTLKGKKVGVVDGRNMDTLLQRWVKGHQNVGIEVKRFPHFKQLHEAFMAEEIDGIVAYSNDSSVLKEVKPLIKLEETPYYFAFNKNRSDLLADFNRAFGILTELNPHFVQNLRIIYDTRTIASTTFTRKEKQWLSAHPKVKVGYFKNYLPFCDEDSHGNATGLLTNVMNEMNSRFSVVSHNKIQYTAFESHTDMAKALAEGRVDMIFPVEGNTWDAEQDGFFLTNPVVSTSMALVFKEKIDENTYDRIAVNRSNSMQLHYTQNLNPDAEIVFYNNIEECLDAVKDGKVNSTVVNGTRVNTLLAPIRYEELSYVALSQKDDRCFAVKAGNDSLVVLLDRGLSLLGSDFGSNAAQMYITTEYTTLDYINQHVYELVLLLLVVFGISHWFVHIQRKKRERILTELEKRNADLEIAQAEAEYANSSKTMFLSNMSHDIRTPMNAIIGFTHLAEQHLEDQEAITNYLKKISISSHHLLSLINEILDMSRIESGKIQLDETEFSLTELIDNLSVITEEGAQEKNISLRFLTDGIRNNMVYADNLRLSQVLINIVGNAIKYTNPDGEVTVSVTQSDTVDNERSMYVFRIKDNGIGMSEEYQKHIFESFTRERTATISRIQGTGLGMAITKKLVEMMLGTIEVSSQVGVGSEFTVTIPLRILSETDKSTMQSAAEPAETQQAKPMVDITGKRVLLVEDNELNQEIASSLLEMLDLQVEVAGNGKLGVEAVEKHDAHYFDIILMDVQMPVMDGYQAAKAIRALADAEKRNIPIVAVTANAFDEDKQQAYDAGMNAHLAKPIDPTSLVEVIQQTLTKD